MVNFSEFSDFHLSNIGEKSSKFKHCVVQQTLEEKVVGHFADTGIQNIFQWFCSIVNNTEFKGI